MKQEGGQDRVMGFSEWEELPGCRKGYIRRVDSVDFIYECRVWEGDKHFPQGWGAAKPPWEREVELSANPGTWWCGTRWADAVPSGSSVPGLLNWRQPQVVGPFRSREEAIEIGEHTMFIADAQRRLGALAPEKPGKP